MGILLIETISMILQIQPHTSALSLGFLFYKSLIFSKKYPTIKVPGIFWQIVSRALYNGSLNLESPIFSIIKGIIMTN